jgi:hypothetical protein
MVLMHGCFTHSLVPSCIRPTYSVNITGTFNATGHFFLRESHLWPEVVFRLVLSDLLHPRIFIVHG